MKKLSKKPLFLLILLIALFLRFFHHTDRISISTDQSRDAIIALESIQQHKLPLLGAPSSAWGFNFGPLYYYFIILFSLIIPSTFAPWIGFTLLSLASIWMFHKIDKLGIFLCLIAAISYGEIFNSLNMLNTALVYFSTILSFYSLHKILTTRSRLYAALLGLSVALAINCHMQAMSLLALLPLSVIFVKADIKKRISLLFSEDLGFVVGFIPLIYFEILHNFAWSKSILDYTLHGQNKFYTPVRWLTEFTEFWPGIFGNVFFGKPQYGLILVSLIAIAVIISVIKKIKPTQLTLCIAVTFVVEILSVRYYKGPRSPEYFIIAIPFVIYFISWAISVIFKLNKVIGSLAIILLITLGLPGFKTALSANPHNLQVKALYQEINNKYPGKISLSSFTNSDEGARIIYYLLLKDHKISSDAPDHLVICDMHESVGRSVEYCPKDNRNIQVGRFALYDYTSFKKAEIDGYQISTVSAEVLYKRLYNNYELIKY